MNEELTTITKALHVNLTRIEKVFETLSSGLQEAYAEYKEIDGWWLERIRYRIVKYTCDDTGAILTETILREYSLL